LSVLSSNLQAHPNSTKEAGYKSIIHRVSPHCAEFISINGPVLIQVVKSHLLNAKFAHPLQYQSVRRDKKRESKNVSEEPLSNLN